MIQASFNPPATSIIPLHGLDLRPYLDVDSSGVARLHLEPEQLPELGLPESARATLEDLLTINSPLPLGAAMRASSRRRKAASKTGRRLLINRVPSVDGPTTVRNSLRALSGPRTFELEAT